MCGWLYVESFENQDLCAVSSCSLLNQWLVQVLSGVGLPSLNRTEGETSSGTQRYNSLSCSISTAQAQPKLL